jgi:hypothetical protein
MSLTPRKALMIAAFVLVIILAACSGAPEATPAPTQVCPECPPQIICPEPIVCPEPETKEVPFEEEWEFSGHADITAVAFSYWDNNDPAVIPANCARCHSTFGMLDFLGLDGTEVGVVNNDAPTGSVVMCIACHNEATVNLSSVTFPSGIEVTGLGAEARCMLCHQGRASKVQVDNAIANAGLTDEDTPAEELGFVNIHYYSAAVSRFGSTIEGGYEYDGKSYDVRFDHVEGFDTCTSCHNPHSLELEITACQSCHPGVETREDLRNIRSLASLTDYDGDGDISVGIYYEIVGLQEMLYQAIQAYAAEVAGTPIVYSKDAHPYFFIDTNADGITDADEVAFPNRFNAWTARLEKAAYNYQTSLKDPGAFAHGGKYIIQLLYDSIESLNERLSEPIDLSTANRIDAGHFAGSEPAFRYWDAAGAVPNTCAKCHTGTGVPFFLEHGVNIAAAPTNSLLCETCHNDVSTFTRYEVGPVTFPSGARLEMANADNNLCMLCHQGRASANDINRAIAGKDMDTIDESLRFINIHYFAAASTLFGTEAKGVYEFPDKEYLGKYEHIPAFSNCTDCHDTHALEPKTEACFACHQVDDVALIRAPGNTIDYDGDGDVTEGMKGEIETLHEALYAALQAYANETIGTGIVYSSARHPYFFIDTNGNGVADPEEINADNRYASFTPRLLIAVYNYQYVAKDPGAFVHNGEYVIQVLLDTLEDLGAPVEGATRP